MNSILAVDLLISEATEPPKGIRETGEPATQFLVMLNAFPGCRVHKHFAINILVYMHDHQ
jgi:hypothetical protein